MKSSGAHTVFRSTVAINASNKNDQEDHRTACSANTAFVQTWLNDWRALGKNKRQVKLS